MKFSGKERDTESNLDYFGARYYGNYYYRWLSPDPVINKDTALTNPQLWNLYSFCHNNPVTYWDPNGAIVRTDEVGYGVIKATMGDEVLAKNISWNAESGLIDVNRSIRTDNTNYIALRYLVDSAQEVVVSVTDKVLYIDNTHEIKVPWLMNLPKEGWQGMTIYPRHGREEAISVHNKDYILCAVSSFLGQSEKARALAHELYGHAYLYIRNKAFQHEPGTFGGWDPNGKVNTYIMRIEERRY